ncbi:UNVERIFIED_CONTAM: Ornithine decarboxylase [Sesamum radiatum]|uniref:ornithine decarboxylase n=1 Tax=Sesamum radiatum TaxID=300843 RepID=A0AAW2PYP6_SESRA
MACQSTTNGKKSTLMPLLSAASQAPSTPENDSPLPNNTLLDFIQSVIVNKQENKEPFYVLDLGVVASLMNRWTRNLPNVRPFYAVKCNPDASLLSAMAAHGSNFDCASRAEIEAVLSLGVSPNCVIFANPCVVERGRTCRHCSGPRVMPLMWCSRTTSSRSCSSVIG